MATAVGKLEFRNEGFEKPRPLAAEAASPVGKWRNWLDVRSYSKVSIQFFHTLRLRDHFFQEYSS